MPAGSIKDTPATVTVAALRPSLSTPPLLLPPLPPPAADAACDNISSSASDEQSNTGVDNKNDRLRFIQRSFYDVFRSSPLVLVDEVAWSSTPDTSRSEIMCIQAPASR